MKLPTGIYKTKYGYRVVVRVNGHPYTKRFKKRDDPTITEMKDCRAALRTDALRAALTPEPSSTFTDDVDRYLRAVRTMPTYDEREQHMLAWVKELGEKRQRQSITSSDIRTVLQQWRLSGRKDGKGLSESACNHRRTALMHFFSVMNGKGGFNPVREIPRFREPDPTPRGLPYQQLTKVFAAMRDSKTKARIMVMAYTGLPHSTIARLTPANLNTRKKTLLVPRRRKGSGTKTRVLPLMPEAIAAFKMLKTFDGWGPFSRSSLRKALHRACVTAKVQVIRPYDLRHSFGSAVYAATGDIAAAQALLDHSDVKMTKRYTLSAVEEQMRKALNKTRESFQ